MTNREETLALIEELKKASQSYYQDLEESFLSDEEFDEKIELLRNAKNSNLYPDLFTNGSPGHDLLEGAVALGSSVNLKGVRTVTHTIPMLSLRKAKTPEELDSYLTKMYAEGAKDFQLQAKLDGLAVCARYSNGGLHTLAVRGDGVVGEEITYLAFANKVTIKGLPLTVSTKTDFEVRGEIFFTEEQFQSVNAAQLETTGAEFKNSRNSAVGLLKKAKLGVSYPVEFTYSIYNAYTDNGYLDLTDITDDSFITVNQLTTKQAPNLKLSGFKKKEEVKAAVAAFGVARENFTIPTDGVVIKPTNESEMNRKLGYSSHSPNSQIAYKYPGVKVQTEVLGFSVSVGKTGRVTPTAIVRPVKVAGSLLENASCHNYNWIYERDLRVGSVVLITKNNDVIPQVHAVISNPAGTVPVPIPTTCPHCNSTLENKNPEVWPPKLLLCANKACPSRDSFALNVAVGKSYLNIDKLSTATLNSLMATGRVKDISDLYTLTLEELAESANGVSTKGTPRKLGEKTATHILKHIEASKELPLDRILISLNIEGLGPSTAKELVKRYPTIEKLLQATEEELQKIPDFGYITAHNVVEGLQYRRPLIEKLQNYGVKFESPAKTAPTSSALSGLSFAISGEVPSPFPNRNAWVEYLEANGAEFHSSPKKDTSFMVAEESGTSSKIIKAKTLGVPFITAEEFIKKYSNS